MAGVSIKFDRLTLGYGGSPALWRISGAACAGALIAVVGPNGSGKSTLLKGIAGVLPPMAGACHMAPGARLAYLPQLSEIDRSFPASVVDLVSLGLWPDRGSLLRHGAKERMRIADALACVGLAIILAAGFLYLLSVILTMGAASRLRRSTRAGREKTARLTPHE